MRLSMKDFRKDAKGKVKKQDVMNWKPKAIVWLHPSSGIEKRNVHWFPVYRLREVEGKKGKKEKKWIISNEMIICPGVEECAICQLVAKLKANDDIDDDQVILEIGEGKDSIEYLKGDIIRTSGFDWQKDLRYRTEYLFGAIHHSAKKRNGVEPLIVPKSLGTKISKVIDNRIDDKGEEKGDPFVTPYAFKLMYDEDADPNNKYDAEYNDAELDDDIEELLEGEGIDLAPFIEPSDHDYIKYLVSKYLQIDAEEIGFDDDELKISKDKQKKFDSWLEGKEEKSSKNKNDEEEDEEIEDEDDEEDEKSKKNKEKDKKKKNKKKNKNDEEEDEEIEDEDDEEDEKSKKNKEKDKKKKNEKKNKNDEDDDDSKKSKLKNKNKKNNKDEEDEEDEKPKKNKNKKNKDKDMKKKDKKKNKDDDEDEEVAECPECGKEVDVDATECPHCGAEFETEIECPHCNEMIPADSDECPECGETIVPF